MIVMYDSTEVSTVPPNPQAVAGYTSGNWPTYEPLVRAFPHAHHVSINVTSAYQGEILDCEAGDVPPEDHGTIINWLKGSQEAGIFRPGPYASVSNMNGIVDALLGAGHPRDSFRVWSAHYTYHPHLCGGDCGLNTTADMTQWTDKALGRNLDESLCQDEAFGPVVPPRPPLAVLWPHEREAVELVDRLNAHPAKRGPALARARAWVVMLRKAIYTAAEDEIKAGKPAKEAWAYRARGARYAILWSRTRGFK
jgi:hypothetical protein